MHFNSINDDIKLILLSFLQHVLQQLHTSISHQITASCFTP